MLASKTRRILLPVLLMMGVFTLSVLHFTKAASQEDEMAKAVEDIRNQIEREIQSHPALAMSSNPYDYAEQLSGVDAMVRLGPSALPYIEQAIDESSGSGLMDYLLAVAAETISKVDLKSRPGTLWDTGDSFKRQWRQQLRQTPQEVRKIAGSDLSPDEKVRSLERLGVPAVPFIIEQVKEGKQELFPAIITILSGNPATSPGSFSDETKWIRENEKRFNDLKSYVLSKSGE